MTTAVPKPSGDSSRKDDVDKSLSCLDHAALNRSVEGMEIQPLLQESIALRAAVAGSKLSLLEH